MLPPSDPAFVTVSALVRAQDGWDTGTELGLATAYGMLVRQHRTG
jgi:hypothetical protein